MPRTELATKAAKPAIDKLTSAVFDNGNRGNPRVGCDCVQCFGYCIINADVWTRVLGNMPADPAVLRAAHQVSVQGVSELDFDNDVVSLDDMYDVLPDPRNVDFGL